MLKKIFLISESEYLRWLISPRVILLFMIWVFIDNCALEPLAQCVSDTGKNLCVFEPFIAVGNSPLLMMILPLGYITVMADFPKADRAALLSVFRCGRLSWALGQFLFSIYAAATYCVVMLLSSTLPLVTISYFGNEWSDGVRLYKNIFPDRTGSAVTSLLPENLYNQMSPAAALINTFFLMLLCMLALSTVMLLFRLTGYKKMGFFAACGIIGAGAALTAISSPAMWATPIGNAILYKHLTMFYRAQIFPVWASYLYFAVFIAVMIIASAAISGKSNFETTAEED